MPALSHCVLFSIVCTFLLLLAGHCSNVIFVLLLKRVGCDDLNVLTISPCYWLIIRQAQTIWFFIYLFQWCELAKKNVDVVCHCRPVSFLRLTWYRKLGIKNRTEIVADNVKYALSMYSRVLTVRDVTRSDSGVYQCEAVFARPGVETSPSVIAEANLIVFGKRHFVSSTMTAF